MEKRLKVSVFELLMLVVGLLGTFLGFKLINSLFAVDKVMSWGMLNAIFLWLILMTIFILLSFTVEVSKKHYEETKSMHNLIKTLQEQMYVEQEEIEKTLTKQKRAAGKRYAANEEIKESLNEQDSVAVTDHLEGEKKGEGEETLNVQ
ncbi:hypothetical protein JXA85_02500 [Candidatus Woesearchaeota archaeon]|nr:hypothetical protein [Candidatus Woesearchaeota archaeon]